MGSFGKALTIYVVAVALCVLLILIDPGDHARHLTIIHP